MPRNWFSPSRIFARHWPASLSIIVATVTLIVLGTVVWLALIAEAAVDRAAIERQRRFAATGLADWFAAIPKDQESITIWDDAVLRTKDRDLTWTAENIGEWMATYFGHDEVYVLDSLDRPFYAMAGGTTQPDATAAWASVAPVIGPLVTSLRREMAAASEGLSDSTAAVAHLGKQDYVLLDGAPAIVSAKPIVPFTDRLTQAPGDEFIHITIKHLDGTVAAAIANRFELNGARFVAPGDHPSASAFVERLGSTPEADAIVRTIVALARAMKRRVTAEGVETVEQRDHLASLGCHELQGFLFSRPVPEAELACMVDVAQATRAVQPDTGRSRWETA